jgi:hypothetical protein
VASARGFGVVLLAVLVGLILGSLAGELIARYVSSPWVKDLLTRGPTVGITPPTTLDVRLLSVTFGIVVKINVVGVLGILVALVAIRRF